MITSIGFVIGGLGVVLALAGWLFYGLIPAINRKLDRHFESIATSSAHPQKYPPSARGAAKATNR